MNPFLYLILYSPKLLVLLLFRRRGLPAFLRESLLALGPVYIKLGQVLSTRRDILPEDYIQALKTLRDDIPPVASRVMRPFIEQNLDLGMFSTFDFTPFAAGAVAQVHTGFLKDGSKVAVKVIRPRIRSTIERNFRFLLRLVSVVFWLRPGLQVLNTISILKNFRQFLEDQVNLDIERANYEKFRALDDDDLYIPHVYETLSHSAVLVTEFIDGVLPDEYQKLAISPSRLAAKIDGLIEKMVFRYGLCHVDLHPGNFFWNRRGQIVLVDLGLVYSLDRRERNHIMTFWMAFTEHYYEYAVRYFVEHFTTPLSVDVKVNKDEAFVKIFAIIKQRVLDTRGTFDFAFFFYEIIKVLSQYRLKPEANYFNILLTTIAIDGYAVYIDPGFDTIAATRQKIFQDREAAILTAGAEGVLFGDEGYDATPLFLNSSDSLDCANRQRDEFILDALEVKEQEFILQLGCGRGKFLHKCLAKGSRVLGVTLSESEVQSCRQKGIDCVRSRWEDLDGKMEQYPKADSVVLIEFLKEIVTLHELGEGFAEVKLQRLFASLHTKIKKGGKLFLRCPHLPDGFTRDPQFAADYQTMYNEFPWIGFVTLPLLEKTVSPHFRLIQTWDHSESLVPFFRAVDTNITHLIGQLQDIFVPEPVMTGQRVIRFLTEISARRILKLQSMLFVS